jgi:hypothetical protein
VQRGRFLARDARRVRLGRELGALADVRRDLGTDAHELLLQEARQRARLALLEHRDQASELDAVRVRLDLDRLGGRCLVARS